MSRGYTTDGRRLSSMTHAERGHPCKVCGAVMFGNGGTVSHGRAHVRRGEAVELVKHWDHGTPSRVFVVPGDAESPFRGRGFAEVTP